MAMPMLVILSRTITDSDVRNNKLSPEFVDGVAVCLRHGADNYGKNIDPKLWFYKEEWANFIAGVKSGALDKFLEDIGSDEVFKLMDTKLPAKERQRPAIPVRDELPGRIPRPLFQPG